MQDGSIIPQKVSAQSRIRNKRAEKCCIRRHTRTQYSRAPEYGPPAVLPALARTYIRGSCQSPQLSRLQQQHYTAFIMSGKYVFGSRQRVYTVNPLYAYRHRARSLARAMGFKAGLCRSAFFIASPYTRAAPAHWHFSRYMLERERGERKDKEHKPMQPRCARNYRFRELATHFASSRSLSRTQ